MDQLEASAIESNHSEPLDVGALAEQACLLEATTQKIGNVHPGESFDDMTWADFVISAQVIRPIMAKACDQPLGQTILDAVTATNAAVDVNTNLGLILLLAPLCAVQPDEALATGLPRVLAGTTIEDAKLTYEAIRLASPAGLGEAPEADISETPNVTLVEAMKLAADRDAIAAAYATDFHDLLTTTTPRLLALLQSEHYVDDAVIALHLACMANGDSLIARKHGDEVATQVATRAQELLTLWHESENAENRATACTAFDTWLRDRFPPINPGTSADLVGAALFIALRAGQLKPPYRWRNPLRFEACAS